MCIVSKYKNILDETERSIEPDHMGTKNYSLEPYTKVTVYSPYKDPIINAIQFIVLNGDIHPFACLWFGPLLGFGPLLTLPDL